MAASDHEELIMKAGDLALVPQDTDSYDTSQAERSSTKKRSGLLRRLRESVLIKSKAAIMILFWSTLAHLLYGFLLNPDIYFTIPIRQLLAYPFQDIDVLKTTGGSIAFINIIGAGFYGLIAIWLLFYPLAGYLADVRYGRYRVVIFGLKFMWAALFVLIVGAIVFTAVFLPISLIVVKNLVLYVVFIAGIGLLSYLMLLTGLSAFAANAIQFGLDQLQDHPTRDSFLFIYWYLWTQYIGISIGKLAWSTTASPILSMVATGLLGLIFVFVLVILPISFRKAKQSWFVTNPGTRNPYREVAQVVSFARKYKVPIQRSAFTYWEDDIPAGLDLGKSKYGGPFTTEQVENVKAFFGILYILLSLGPFFTADIAASAFLPILKYHMMTENILNTFNVEHFEVNDVFANGGTLYPVFIMILIPVFLKIIHPLFQKYVSSILTRIGIGLCLVCVSLLCSLLVDSIGHALPGGYNSTSIFDPGRAMENNGSFLFSKDFVDAPSLHLNPYILIVQNFIVAVAYILIYGGVFEFICAQSPHSMKGVLIGVFFAVKGLFQLIGVLGILLPFSFSQKFNRTGLLYFLLNIVISAVGVVAFIITTRRYQYREREDFCNERKYIEEFYENDVKHNVDYEDLDVDFSSDPETSHSM